MATSIGPDALASLVAPLVERSLLGFDVDGVLAPIVDHADDSRLGDGVADAMARLARRGSVAVVSGRSLESLDRLFDFDPAVIVVGSHGLEERGSGEVALDADERNAFEQLEMLANKTVEAIGDGAWVERKLASVVVHTRQADVEATAAAVPVLLRLAGMVDGATIKPGSEVVELLARPANKGAAFASLASRLNKPAGFFIGDDETDEDAFAALDPVGISVRVGPGDTIATHRLESAADAATFVRTLAE